MAGADHLTGAVQGFCEAIENDALDQTIWAPEVRAAWAELVAALHRAEAQVTAQDGVGIIAAERARQRSEEGWTAEHDAEHEGGQLASAAAAYATFDLDIMDGDEHADLLDQLWPFGLEWWKPSGEPIRNLAKAGALIAAEIDRRLLAKG